MLIPAIQYGDWKTVKGRMGKVVTQLKRGAPLHELMTCDGMLDTDSHPGRLVMIRSMLGPVSNFHMFAPLRPAWETMEDIRVEPPPQALMDAIFEACIETPWGVLGLMSHDNGPWVWPTERHHAFLAAALRYWDELDALGPRYYTFGQMGPLWDAAHGLKYVLANMGVATDVLNAPLPPEGPRALLPHAWAQA